MSETKLNCPHGLKPGGVHPCSKSECLGCLGMAIAYMLDVHVSKCVNSDNSVPVASDDIMVSSRPAEIRQFARSSRAM